MRYSQHPENEINTSPIRICRKKQHPCKNPSGL
jgi:hypothetical protein